MDSPFARQELAELIGRMLTRFKQGSSHVFLIPGLQHSCSYVIGGCCDREIHGGKRDDASLPDRLFQRLKYLEMANGIFSRTCRFFYFDRIECPILMNEQIDLFGVFVAIVINGSARSGVPRFKQVDDA
jgi:hypothetical protein